MCNACTVVGGVVRVFVLEFLQDEGGVVLGRRAVHLAVDEVVPHERLEEHDERGRWAEHRAAQLQHAGEEERASAHLAQSFLALFTRNVFTPCFCSFATETGT